MIDTKSNGPGLLEIAIAIAKGEAVFFIGAGLSAGAGAPVWGQLVDALKQSLDPPIEETRHELIAQFFRNQHGDHALFSRVRSMLKSSALAPTKAHRTLCAMPVNVFLTTNYDDLIEVTLRELRRPFHVIVDDEELALWNEAEEIQIVKLHGDLNRSRSIVLTEEDYTRFLQENVALQRKLLDIFCYRTVIFIGYSLRDADIALVYNQVVHKLGRLKRPAYTLTFEGEPHVRREWERRGIRPIVLAGGPGANSLTDVLSSALSVVQEQVSILASPHRCDILIVEDDQDLVAMMQRSFRRDFPEASIEVAFDGLEASMAIGRLRPRVVCIDIRMPRMDGLKLIELIRRDAQHDDTRLIIVSAYTFDVEHASALKVDAIVQKPYEQRELADIIRGFLPALRGGAAPS